MTIREARTQRGSAGLQKQMSGAGARTELNAIPALDGLRGLAALLVISFHASYPFWRQRIDIEDVLKVGWSGVDLFFVLSGFLITRILLHTLEQPNYFSSFYARRALRIFPLYYAFLAIFLVSLLFHSSLLTNTPTLAERQVVLSSLYVQDYIIPSDIRHFYSPLLHTWSLAIEEQFYLIWPLLIRWAGQHRVLPLCLLVVVAAMAARAFLLLRGFTPIEVYMYAPTRIDALAGGAGIAAYFERYRDPSYPIVFGLLGAGIAGVLIALWRGVGDLYFESSAMAYFGYAGFDFLFCAFVALVLCKVRLWVALFEPPLLRRVGRYSYCMYLAHWPLILLLGSWDVPGMAMRHLPYHIAFFFFLALVTALSFMLAHLSSAYFETPILRLKARFPIEPAVARER